MRLLLHTMATPELDPIAALDLAAELQLDGLDLICQADYRCALPPDAPIETARSLRAEAQRRGLVIGALTPYEKRVNHPLARERDEAVASLVHAIDLAEALGATSVRVFGGAEVRDDDWTIAAGRLVESLHRIAPHAAARGIGLNIENHDGTMADSAARTHELWRRTGKEIVGIVYDPANLIRDGKEDFPASLDLQAEAIRLVHVKDYSFIPGAERRGAVEQSRRSVPLGDGDVPWTDIIAALAALGYDGDLTFEYEMRWVPDQLPPTRIGVARSRDFVRRALAQAATAERTATALAKLG
ncbi:MULTISPECIES: sugar phosphate isomerase/epimerase [unclassified Chelatococcus]|uniref:sugar phosphate isomerase/epimerase family protein n=1 Tax=unclassified Chelatococcus TaxID=2638111 RepID=UPI001BD1020C|nr:MULTISPECIES: sugar phosphate isomerase/epimerase [unclassified Chelatococcus]MBS7699984.1 sugar phosphate isomerase/epimerase [Chelatococcus sp. YT9]MBX3558591.1 sugar phosphate isomerase/epimerase [Chelatococcus sp.]